MSVYRQYNYLDCNHQVISCHHSCLCPEQERKDLLTLADLNAIAAGVSPCLLLPAPPPPAHFTPSPSLSHQHQEHRHNHSCLSSCNRWLATGCELLPVAGIAFQKQSTSALTRQHSPRLFAASYRMKEDTARSSHPIKFSLNDPTAPAALSYYLLRA